MLGFGAAYSDAEIAAVANCVTARFGSATSFAGPRMKPIYTRLQRGRSGRRTFLATLSPATGRLDTGSYVPGIELIPASP